MKYCTEENCIWIFHCHLQVFSYQPTGAMLSLKAQPWEKRIPVPMNYLKIDTFQGLPMYFDLLSQISSQTDSQQQECFENLVTETTSVFLAALIGMERMQWAEKVAFVVSWTGYVTVPGALPHWYWLQQLNHQFCSKSSKQSASPDGIVIFRPVLADFVVCYQFAVTLAWWKDLPFCVLGLGREQWTETSSHKKQFTTA